MTAYARDRSSFGYGCRNSDRQTGLRRMHLVHPLEETHLGSSCHAGRTGQLRVAVRLLVEPSVARDLLELEPLHRNGVERAALDAQRAADAALLVEDHRRPLLPAVGLLDLGQEALGLELVDVRPCG